MKNWEHEEKRYFFWRNHMNDKNDLDGGKEELDEVDKINRNVKDQKLQVNKILV